MLNSNLEKKKVSVIIVNFRSDQFLNKCIASLFRWENSADFEIILVNNDREKDLGEIVDFFPEVVVMNNEKNLGFGSAVNLGAKKAQGEILFFLNPDSEMQEPVFSLIMQKFEQENDLAVLSPSIIDEEGKKQSWTFGKKLTLGQLLKNNLWGDEPDNKNLEKEVDWVSGAGMFARRDDFLKAGGFDENFFMYFEDLDLCWRLRKLDKKIIYFPEVQIKHIGSGSVMKEKERKERYYSSQDYYFQKHFGKFQAGVVRSLRKILK